VLQFVDANPDEYNARFMCVETCIRLCVFLERNSRCIFVGARNVCNRSCRDKCDTYFMFATEVIETSVTHILCLQQKL
jgi:hypothetical protein